MASKKDKLGPYGAWDGESPRNRGSSVSKPATSQRVSADRQTALGQAALAKLGNYLSGRGGGSADAQAGRGASRVRALQIAVQTARGGGQGKVAPKPVSKPAPKKSQGSQGFRKNTPSGGKPGKK